MPLFDPDQNTRHTAELAAQFGVTARTIRNWCRSGRVHAIKTEGGHWRINDRFPAVEKNRRPDENAHRKTEKTAAPHGMAVRDIEDQDHVVIEVQTNRLPSNFEELLTRVKIDPVELFKLIEDLGREVLDLARLPDLAARVNRADLARTAETAAREAYQAEIRRQRLAIQELERQLTLLQGDSGLIRYGEDHTPGY